MSPINLAIVGVGKIVRDQHLPSIAKNPDFKLVATASRHGTVEGIQSFTTIDAMLDAVPAIDAVSLCMPPQYRYEAAHKALSATKHVFLEKPPGATLSEVADLEKLAAISGRLAEQFPYATGISAGMSQDLEEAVRFGATHLRIGSDILGPRPALR